MNPSERLHNQGSEQQNITPELKLSMELRAKCEQLLLEKGRNSFHFYPFLLAITPVVNIGVLLELGLIDKLKPQQGVASRYVALEEKGNNVLIVCTGFNPRKAKHVDVYSSRKDNEDYVSYVSQLKGKRRSEVNEEALRLDKSQRGRIIEPQRVQEFLFEATKIQVARRATVEDLSYYQTKINQSSPIEHK